MSVPILLLLLITSAICQPRPPHARPPADQLNYDCLANTNLPKFTPSLDPKTVRTIYCPQSDTTYYLVSRWILAFSAYYPSIVLNAPVIGSGIAGPCLANASCDMSIIGREMLLAEQALFQEAHGYLPFEFPVAGGSYAALAFTDAMTVMVHPSNPLTRITFAQFDAIFSTTRNRLYSTDISTWGQLGLKGEWFDKKITLIGVEVPNGFEYFLNRTMLDGGKWKDTIITRKTVFELATLVSLEPYSIGYTGLAFLNATVKQLLLSEDGGWPYTNEESYYAPEKSNVCSRYYPLSRLIYLYTHKQPNLPLDPVIKEFLMFVLSYEGQKAVEDDMIFYPLSVSVADRLRKQLA